MSKSFQGYTNKIKDLQSSFELFPKDFVWGDIGYGLIHKFADPGAPIWVPKLYAQIKE